MKPNVARLESIDVARGLAALSVAVYHQGYGAGLAQVTGWAGFRCLGWPGAYFAVPLFFVISGFCIHLGGLARQDDPGFTRTFFIQRFWRIYPPWFVAVLVSALVAWWKGAPPTTGEILSHLTLTNGFIDNYRLNPALWSVSVECCLYLLYPAWLAFRRRRGLAAGCLLGLAVSALSGAIMSRWQAVPSGPALWFFLNVWCGWLAGAVLAEGLQAPSLRLLRRPGWWIGGALAILLHAACFQAGVYRGRMAYAELPLTIMLGVWPLALLIATGEILAGHPARALVARAWRALAAVGWISYSLYLLHVPLQALSFVIVSHLATSWAKALLFAAWLGVVLGASWLHYRWVEMPAIAWGRRLVARGRMAPASVPSP